MGRVAAEGGGARLERDWCDALGRARAETHDARHVGATELVDEAGAA